MMRQNLSRQADKKGFVTYVYKINLQIYVKLSCEPLENMVV